MSHLLLLGATGQVGQHLLRAALADARVTQITAPTRRALPPHAKLHNPQPDFTALPTDAAWWRADAVLCALGTTLKLAGSRAAFYQVDHDLVLQCARLAHLAGSPCFVLNSSSGARLKSPSFYLRVKAQVERDVEALAFPALVIVRPSLLITEQRPDQRRGEALGLALSRVFAPLLPPRIRPIHCEKVAVAMLHAGLQGKAGKLILESEQMQ